MALKPADYYGNVLALKAKCPPGSSQAAYYTAIAEMVLSMLKDADVDPLTGTPPMTTPTGGPVSGLGKIK